ncbi:MAG TPA: ParB N-terminal domain-containing protein [Candidatus Bathyarchaeia archaeon]|nr:ParB N-terminal domain-containing protein [Candidatus Bathyarchaeia archaeon]
MGLASSTRSFILVNAKVPLQIQLKKIHDLRPHEETVPADLAAIAQDMKTDGTLRHPIVADVRSGTVLDGTHRLAALSQLGYEYAPAALIDYENPLVQVDRWHRIIGGEALDTFIKTCNLGPSKASLADADTFLSERRAYAALHDMQECFVFRSGASDPLELSRQAFRLEEFARHSELGISYVDNPRSQSVEEPAFVMSTILVTKPEVVDAATRRHLFPPKTTRHLIPSRPLATRVPLEWLRGREHGKAERLFLRHLRSKTIKRLPEGSWIGSRRYQEEVFVFE